jgi:hypothetical protein
VRIVEPTEIYPRRTHPFSVASTPVAPRVSNPVDRVRVYVVILVVLAVVVAWHHRRVGDDFKRRVDA